MGELTLKKHPGEASLKSMRKKTYPCEIVESYRDYTPPVRVDKCVKRLLRGVSPDYLAGIKTIVLTNYAALNHNRRRKKTKSRGKTYGADQFYGMYYRKRRGAPAWIELFIDKIIPNQTYERLSRVPIIVDVLIGKVLFHEIGHHIHAVRAPEHREPEDVADEWRDKLCSEYGRKKYWYLLPFIKPMYYLLLVYTKARKAIRKT